MTDLRILLAMLSKRSKRLWWLSVCCAVISNVFEIFAAGTFSIMVSSSLGGRKSNFGVLTSIIPFRLTLKILLLLLFLSFLGKLFFQSLELSLKTHVASSLFQSLFSTLHSSAKGDAKEFFTSKSQNVKFLHDIIHNVYYPATLIVSESVLLLLFVPFIFLFAPKASFLIFGITTLLSLPSIKFIGYRLKKVNMRRTDLDHLLDAKLFDQARINEDLGFVSQHELKMKETIREICSYDRKIVQYGSYSRFIVEFIFILSVVTTFMFLDNLVVKESRVQFLAVLAYSFFRIVPAFSRIMSAKNLVYSHSYKLKELNAVSTKVELAEELIPYSGFKRSFSIRSNDGQLQSGFGEEIDVHRGDWVLIKAKTGVGKTTLLKKIAGINLLGYMVLIDNKPLSAGVKWHPKIGYVSQTPYLVGSSMLQMVTGGDSLSPRETLLYQRCIDVAGLGETVRLSVSPISNVTLSGGQRKQIALARALFAQPEILILDEMTAGMDLQLAEEILDRLKSKISVSVVVMTTHEDHFNSYFNKTYLLERSIELNN